MNFLSVAQADRHAAEKTAGKSQLFLCPLVTLCSHCMQQPHFLDLYLGDRVTTHSNPTALRCFTTPPHPRPHCLLRSLLAATGLRAGFAEFLLHLSESHSLRMLGQQEGPLESQVQPHSIVSPTLSSVTRFVLSIYPGWGMMLGASYRGASQSDSGSPPHCWVSIQMISHEHW